MYKSSRVKHQLFNQPIKQVREYDNPEIMRLIIIAVNSMPVGADYFGSNQYKKYMNEIIESNVNKEIPVTEFTTNLSIMSQNGGFRGNIMEIDGWQEFILKHGEVDENFIQFNNLELIFMDHIRKYYLLKETKKNTPMYEPGECDKFIIAGYVQFMLKQIHANLQINPDHSLYHFYDALNEINDKKCTYFNSLLSLWEKQGYKKQSIRAIFPTALQLLPAFTLGKILHPRAAEIFELFALSQYAQFYRTKISTKKNRNNSSISHNSVRN